MAFPTTSRKKIVLAEEDEGARKRLARFLTSVEYDVISATDGKQALEAIKSSEPDLVILDMKMPSIGDLEVLKRLRRTDPAVRVLVMTVKSRISDVEKALPLADDYITKPVDLADLRARITRTLARARASTAPAVRVVLQELHDSDSGRISADRVAEHLGVPLKQLAEALNANYVTVHKTPDAEGLQEGLLPIKRSLEILHEIVGDLKTIRVWLNSPHPDLGARTPIQVILEGKAGALRSILENAISGTPS